MTEPDKNAVTERGSNPSWAAGAEAVLAMAGVSRDEGLGPDEVVRRRERHGWNRLPAPKAKPAWRRFLAQLNDPLVWVLLAAAGLAAFLGEWVDSGVIVGVVVVNAIVGFIQESKAERAIGALSGMIRTEATVRRAGRIGRLASEELVPGDIVLLQAGDRVPADLRLLELRGLQCEEAALTGESVPSAKSVESLPVEASLGDRKNMAFAGTLVTGGTGEGVVVETGSRTETGRIAELLTGAADLTTPLGRKVSAFSRVLVYVILVLAAVTFLVGVIQGHGAAEMFMAAVALAVGAIPEGLPAAVTITLAIGVSRMARRGAIIRRLPAVETLGSTTVICSDKTGTLTENQMTVRELWVGGESFEATGTGYDAKGEVLKDRSVVKLASAQGLVELLRAGVLCNDTRIVSKEGRPVVEGDPTEAALLVVARKAGVETEGMEAGGARVDVIPFESEHMFMATLHEGDPRVIYKKGSVERILERCDRMLLADGVEQPVDVGAVQAAVGAMAAKGLRILAFARRHVDEDHDELRHEHVAAGLTFLGLQGMMDPPRAEARQAIADCARAGIGVKMITGDHAITASAIATQLGLQGERTEDGRLAVVTGRELERMDAARLSEVAERTAVFARVAPEQKLRLVEALQGRGHVVAMTGDGVNDAPALKRADIGVAMGISGTDVAKGAAAMVLTDDNFATIRSAVEEGRTVFDNLVKFIVWTIPTNGGEGLILMTAIFLGMTLPILPVQLLWINMTTAVLLGLTLVFEPAEKGLMSRPPRDPARPLLTLPLLMRSGLVSVLMLCAGMGLFIWEQRANGVSLDEARTIVVNTIVVAEMAYLLNCRSLSHSVFATGLGGNRWIWGGIGLMLVLQVAFCELPWMNRLFHSAPVRLDTWLHVGLVGLVVLVVVEFEKWMRFGGGRGRAVVPE